MHWTTLGGMDLPIFSQSLPCNPLLEDVYKHFDIKITYVVSVLVFEGK